MAFFETVYLLVYLTQRNLRDQWGLVRTGNTTLTLDLITFWVLNEAVGAVLGHDRTSSDVATDERIANLVTDHEMAYATRQSTYDRLPVGTGQTARYVLIPMFIDYIQTRIGCSFDPQEKLALVVGYDRALTELDPDKTVDEVLAARPNP